MSLVYLMIAVAGMVFSVRAIIFGAKVTNKLFTKLENWITKW